MSPELDLLRADLRGCNASVQRSVLELKIEGEGVVDELLHMKWNLHPANIFVVRVANLSGDIQPSIVVRV